MCVLSCWCVACGVQAKEREKKQYEKEYLASLSKSVKDAKVADYIASRTIDGSDVLDPTGRVFKIEPSQVRPCVVVGVAGIDCCVACLRRQWLILLMFDLPGVWL